VFQDGSNSEVSPSAPWRALVLSCAVASALAVCRENAGPAHSCPLPRVGWAGGAHTQRELRTHAARRAARTGFSLAVRAPSTPRNAGGGRQALHRLQPLDESLARPFPAVQYGPPQPGGLVAGVAVSSAN
jgi:hypothetical protein